MIPVSRKFGSIGENAVVFQVYGSKDSGEDLISTKENSNE